ncbi:aldehyde dehydrogenase family protein [Endozoicomonas atrinae]|uniref:aldehyde dehydrogenase family protein n=1 Tax=Endozoicomonas atrinae TaxID=1333660 RepID=UPI000824F6CB|nr:aldehyde dehydrogenase family protein [Endozoicomonas atrinae]
MGYHPEFDQHWNNIATNLEPEGRALINGEFTEAAEGEVFATYSPADGRFITNIARGSKVDIDRAVAGARASFEAGNWSQVSIYHRIDVMNKLADLIEQNSERLAVLESLDMGKPVRECLHTDVAGSAKAIRYFASCIDKIYGNISPNTGGVGMITREPIGVVAAITPWNFPLYMAIWKVGSALAMGNSVVVKPSERASLTTIELGKLALEAGVPSGVLQVVPGYGHEAGAALGLHNDVDCVSFTGSHVTARKLMAMAGESNGKPVYVEAGGKTANIIFDSADMDAAIPAAAGAIFYNMGEVCFAGSRLLLPESKRDSIIEQLIEHSKLWIPDNPLKDRTMAGALVDGVHLERVQGFVDRAIADGATVMTGGHALHKESGGYYFAPTILTDVRSEMEIAQQEVFGPVLSVLTYQDEEDAVRLANDTNYGLAAALWTNDLSQAHRVAARMKAGNVWVNCFHGGDMSMPFGGYKQSGNTRDKGLIGFEKYTQVKSTWINIKD